MMYGQKSWKLTKSFVNKVKNRQRSMEIAMLGITLIDRKRLTGIREQTKIAYVIKVVKQQQKWTWLEHRAKRNNNRKS